MGTLWTMSRVASALLWPSAGGQCLLCDGGIEDDLHLLTSCNGLLVHREQFARVLDTTLSQAGPPGVELASALRRALVCDEQRALELMAGAPFDYSVCYDGDYARYADMCGKADWLLDKVVKNYLVRCWKARANVVGTLCVEGGVLSREPAVHSTLQPPAWRDQLG
jgi:hypothetical protein